MAAGCPKPKAQQYQNVVNRVLWAGPDTRLVLDCANPPQLHYYLGDPNHVFEALVKIWGDENVSIYARACGAVSKAYQGGGFEG